MLAAQLINGLAGGSIYGLLAIGLSLIYGVMHKLHFAHGEVFMFGAYVALFQTVVIGVPYLASIPLAMLAAAALGVLIERITFRPLRDVPPLQSLVAALGTSLFLQYAAVALFEPKARSLPSPLIESTVSFGFVMTSHQKLLIIVVAIALTVGLEIAMRRSSIGKVVRATTQDPKAAQSLGVDIHRISAVIFAAGSALAGLAGALIAPITYVDPFMGVSMGIKAFVAIILGGFGSVAGTMFAALLIGVVEALATGFTSTANRDLFTYALLLLMLLVRPQGLAGKVARA